MSSDINPLAALDLLDVCDALVRRAQKKGASQVEVYAEQVASLSASLEQGALKGAQAQTHEAFGLRVFVGKRQGFACVNRRDGKALDEAIADALAIARASEDDDGNDLSDPLPTRPIHGLCDPHVKAVEVGDVVTLAQNMLAAAVDEDSRVSVDTGSVSVSHGQTAICTSRGIALADVDTGLQWGLFGMAVDGDEVGSFDYSYDASRSLDRVDVTATGREFAQRTTALLKPRAAKSYTGRVLFAPEAFEEIFLSAILSATDGDNVWKGKSALANKLGERIADAALTIVDDGTVPSAIGSAVFDREGLPHKRTVLVGGGILHRFLYDTKTALRAHKRPTGHAQGSARSLPGIGTTNVRVEPGGLPVPTLLQALGKGLYVTRFSGNVDDVTGDFSGVAKGSFWVHNGHVSYPVKETLIAGNVFSLLPRIVALSNTVKRIMSTEAPHALIDGIVVTAG